MANLREVNPLYCPAHKDMNECLNSSDIYKNMYTQKKVTPGRVYFGCLWSANANYLKLVNCK